MEMYTSFNACYFFKKQSIVRDSFHESDMVFVLA